MPSRKKDVIIRVQNDDNWVMMFGNSYKPWEMQLEEYLFIIKNEGKLDGNLQVTISDNQWVSWGGLKWCPEKDIQRQFNREGCQSNEPDNPNPRQYDEMAFYKDASTTKKVNKMMENLKANIY